MFSVLRALDRNILTAKFLRQHVKHTLNVYIGTSGSWPDGGDHLTIFYLPRIDQIKDATSAGSMALLLLTTRTIKIAANSC